MPGVGSVSHGGAMRPWTPHPHSMMWRWQRHAATHLLFSRSARRSCHVGGAPFSVYCSVAVSKQRQSHVTHAASAPLGSPTNPSRTQSLYIKRKEKGAKSLSEGLWERREQYQSIGAAVGVEVRGGHEKEHTHTERKTRLFSVSFGLSLDDAVLELLDDAGLALDGSDACVVCVGCTDAATVVDHVVEVGHDGADGR